MLIIKGNPLISDFDFENSAIPEGLPDDIRQEDDLLPKSDLLETENEYLIFSELAGMNKNDISVKIENDVLKLSGSRKNGFEKKGSINYLNREIFEGDFTRKFVLPDDADIKNINAEFVNGLLKISIAKKEEIKKEIKVN